ncbi:MAG: hypothetical protein PW734_12380 [Verrucomicrobium sp.]|nr:hypothetical protein [Verrucomicrobium sp.]
MSAPLPLRQEILSPENEAATAELEALAQALGKGAPSVESHATLKQAKLARSSSFFAKQAEKLVALAAERHAVLPADMFKHVQLISSPDDTAETNVFLMQEDRVHKVTQGINFFGYTLFYNSRFNYIENIEATPAEYLARLALANRIFGADNRFEGVAIDEDGAPRIVTSQRYFDSEEEDRPIQEIEVAELMTGEGFCARPSEREWYRPEDGILVDDAHEDNFRRLKNGNIFPIDLMLLKVESSTSRKSLEGQPPAPERFPRLIAGLRRLHLVPRKKQPQTEQEIG